MSINPAQNFQNALEAESKGVHVAWKNHAVELFQGGQGLAQQMQEVQGQVKTLEETIAADAAASSDAISAAADRMGQEAGEDVQDAA